MDIGAHSYSSGVASSSLFPHQDDDVGIQELPSAGPSTIVPTSPPPRREIDVEIQECLSSGPSAVTPTTPVPQPSGLKGKEKVCCTVAAYVRSFLVSNRFLGC